MVTVRLQFCSCCRCRAGRSNVFISHRLINPDVAFHWIGFVLIFIDFFVSGIPVRLLHFYQPLSVALLYNIALVIFTYVMRHHGPFYRVADYFSHDTNVRSISGRFCDRVV